MNAADLAEVAKAAAETAVQTACMAVRDGAERIKADLANGTLTLREELEPAASGPGENAYDMDATAHYGAADDSRFETLAPAPPVRPAAEPEPSAFDFEVETDEDGIPKWE